LKTQSLISLMLLFLLCSCTPVPEPEKAETNSFYSKAYYYPAEELSAGKVYEYVIVHEGEEYLSHFWHLQSEKDTEGNLFLIWNRYNAQLQNDQYIKEWIIEDGVITKEYNFFVLDSATNSIKEYPNDVSQNVVFPFNASTDSAMAYRFVCEMKLPPDFLTAKLIRDRKFAKSTKFNYNGKEVDAVAFTCTDLYDIENVEEGGFWNIKKAVVEIYAKGTGLVYQEEKTAGQEGSEVTKLRAIYSFEEFENLLESKNAES
jgi:hypothetical protein